MSSVSEYFKGLFGGIGALLTGMSVTIKELFAKKVTQQYPENRKTLVISERFRGELSMPHDENNEHACTACKICETNCPNGTIKVISKTIETEDGKKKKILDQYFYNLGMCTFCNLCVLTCPFGAIKFENTFENAIFTRAKLNMRLNQEGSKLREKKKAAPAAKPATDKPAEEKPEKPVAATEKPVEKKTITGEDVEPKGELAHAPDSQVDSNPAAGKPIQSELEKQPVKPDATKSPEAKAKADVEAAEKKAETKSDPVVPNAIIEKGNEKTQENLNQEKPGVAPVADKPAVETKPQVEEKPSTEKPPIKDIIDRRSTTTTTSTQASEKKENSDNKGGDGEEKPKPPRINRI